jgi:hypothetical protein
MGLRPRAPPAPAPGWPRNQPPSPPERAPGCPGIGPRVTSESAPACRRNGSPRQPGIRTPSRYRRRVGGQCERHGGAGLGRSVGRQGSPPCFFMYLDMWAHISQPADQTAGNEWPKASSVLSTWLRQGRATVEQTAGLVSLTRRRCPGRFGRRRETSMLHSRLRRSAHARRVPVAGGTGPRSDAARAGPLLGVRDVRDVLHGLFVDNRQLENNGVCPVAAMIVNSGARGSGSV